MCMFVNTHVFINSFVVCKLLGGGGGGRGGRGGGRGGGEGGEGGGQGFGT